MNKYLLSIAILLNACAFAPTYTESLEVDLNDLSVTNIMDQIKSNNIYFVEFIFCDITGKLHEVLIPAHRVQGALQDGLKFDGSSIAGYTEIYESDMHLEADTDTFTIIPWTSEQNKTARIFCYVRQDKKTPYAADPRYILQQALIKAEQYGFKFLVGPELEFFWFKKDDPQKTCDTNGYFAAEPSLKMQFYKKAIINALLGQGIDVEKLHHEVAPGQHEFSIRYNGALKIADDIMIAKHTITSLANKAGMCATFMPKPIYGQNGSGMHIHFSLYDTHADKNAFHNDSGPAQLSETAQQFLAGVLKYMPEIAGIFNSTINSYKRLVPGYEAPIYLCWAQENRSAMIRIPLTNPDQPYATRAELRSPDALCNPYLALAALLHAGLKGIEEELELCDALEVNLFKLSFDKVKSMGIKTLPHTLDDAINNLLQSTQAIEWFGERAIAEYVKAKQKELRVFNTTVTNWEREIYF